MFSTLTEDLCAMANPARKWLKSYYFAAAFDIWWLRLSVFSVLMDHCNAPMSVGALSLRIMTLEGTGEDCDRYLMYRTHTHTHTHIQSFNGLFSRTTWVGRYQKDKPFWIFWSRDDGVAVASARPYANICTSLRQITMPAPHHSSFYRPDALPAAQSTASKHWR